MELLWFVLLFLAVWGLSIVTRPAKKVRVLYLSKDRQSGSYIRFRPNPAVNLGTFHFCLARKGACQYRKTRHEGTYSRHTNRTGL